MGVIQKAPWIITDDQGNGSAPNPADILTNTQVAALQNVGIGRPLQVLYNSNSGVSSSTNVVSNSPAMDSFTMPGGTMGPNGSLRIGFTVRGLDTSTSKNIRLWANSTILTQFSIGTTNGLALYFMEWHNTGTQNAQVWNNLSAFITPAALATSAIDTSLPVTFYLTADGGTTPHTAPVNFSIQLLRSA